MRLIDEDANKEYLLDGRYVIKPAKHGHWIKNENNTWSCSICQSWIPDENHYYARYCLHCGAKMDLKGEAHEQN